jgi:tRNA-(ms[2]io[6]A)-hydroxylase
MGRKSIDLLTATDPAWASVVLADFGTFLTDHANCERKASAFALSLVAKFPNRTRIIPTLIGIAQEELEHFRLVYQLMEVRGLTVAADTPDPYVSRLLGCMRHGREQRFLDRLLVASLVECRGAERFRIVSEISDEMALERFYHTLWASEVKHAHQYVDMLLHYFDRETVYRRLTELAEQEAAIVRQLPLRSALH